MESWFAICLQEHHRRLVGHANDKRMFFAALLSLAEHSLSIGTESHDLLFPHRDGDPRTGGNPLEQAFEVRNRGGHTVSPNFFAPRSMPIHTRMHRLLANANA